MDSTRIPRVLTIAGSDSSGGAGIQADLKTFTALHCYGMSVITAITAQNTLGVSAVHPIPANIVAEQLTAVLTDIGVDAVKTGMLWDTDIIHTVAETLSKHPIRYLVVDPVLVAKSGDTLLKREAVEALRSLLVSHAWIITPNVPELEVLTGISCSSQELLLEAGKKLLDLGCKFVLIKGGHWNDTEVVHDWLLGLDNFAREFTHPRIETRNTHGTGCTLSSAIACYLAKGMETEQAVGQAIQFVQQAIETAYPLGSGHGPLNHLWRIPY